LAREPLERRSTGIAETEEVRHFIEGFPGRIIQSLSQKTVLTPGRDIQKHGMASAHQQADERRLQLRILERGREEVTFQVIYSDEGPVATERQGLAVHHSDEQGAHESGSGGHRHTIKPWYADAGVSQRLLHDRDNRLDVGPAGEFRNYPAKDSMYVLGKDCQGSQCAATSFSTNHGGGGLITGSLDSEDPLSHR
jgi:hypothetical protein